MSGFWRAPIRIDLVLPNVKEGNGETFYLFRVRIPCFEQYVIEEKRHIILEPRMLVQKIEQIINDKQDRAAGYPRKHFSKLKRGGNCGGRAGAESLSIQGPGPWQTWNRAWNSWVGECCGGGLGKRRERKGHILEEECTKSQM